MLKLPIYIDPNKNLMLMQNMWASILNPFLSTPELNTVLLQNVSLDSGQTLVNHRLGRKLQGWYVVRQRSLAQIYDNQDNNSNPELTLALVSSAPVSVDLVVF